mmetsp:Transcript_24437/g.70540  ORF Transcript_24437/g.70540 Transcript_24437/m.70540 type:complete len:102 (+) Transcript_24437:1303-1608(+)
MPAVQQDQSRQDRRQRSRTPALTLTTTCTTTGTTTGTLHWLAAHRRHHPDDKQQQQQPDHQGSRDGRWHLSTWMRRGLPPAARHRCTPAAEEISMNCGMDR